MAPGETQSNNLQWVSNITPDVTDVGPININDSKEAKDALHGSFFHVNPLRIQFTKPRISMKEASFKCVFSLVSIVDVSKIDKSKTARDPARETIEQLFLQSELASSVWRYYDRACNPGPCSTALSLRDHNGNLVGVNGLKLVDSSKLVDEAITIREDRDSPRSAKMEVNSIYRIGTYEFNSFQEVPTTGKKIINLDKCNTPYIRIKQKTLREGPTKPIFQEGLASKNFERKNGILSSPMEYASD
ncbi:hypothetical protein H5410_045621 [Solanum commersonii]|uniref:Uncharacterized protein n=1 Tax=Solanum commersonii TaxID=4109 RepID=A0A9J5XA32_SOLCO|nr:hypothetical protein H5410_045621 [Solanum commersonii]